MKFVKKSNLSLLMRRPLHRGCGLKWQPTATAIQHNVALFTQRVWIEIVIEHYLEIFLTVALFTEGVD